MSGTSYRIAAFFACAISCVGWNLMAQETGGERFRDVVALVDRHSHIIVLSGDDGATIAVWPAMQGRVLTSSASGPDSAAFGWFNRELIASGKTQPHINAVGGEDRLWIGPEGGQFSIFFAHGAPFDLDHWYTPAPIDTEPFDIVDQGKTWVTFRKAFSLVNYTGTHFNIQIDRQVRLLSSEQVWKHLGIAPVKGIETVGFESENKLTNLASTGWSKSTGLLSLWVLGQFQASQASTIILPIRPGPSSKLGPAVTTNYFGEVPPSRIAILQSAVFFKADAQFRSKLGLSPQRSKGMIGSYSPEKHLLTIVQYTQPAGASEYLNEAWKIQNNPFQGDVANCYNDGPPATGGPQLGHFYELESTSPAEVLSSHSSVVHIQRTIHLVGDESDLAEIARSTLGVSLEAVRAFNP